MKITVTIHTSVINILYMYGTLKSTTLQSGLSITNPPAQGLTQECWGLPWSSFTRREVWETRGSRLPAGCTLQVHVGIGIAVPDSTFYWTAQHQGNLQELAPHRYKGASVRHRQPGFQKPKAHSPFRTFDVSLGAALPKRSLHSAIRTVAQNRSWQEYPYLKRSVKNGFRDAYPDEHACSSLDNSFLLVVLFLIGWLIHSALSVCGIKIFW